MKIIIVTVYNSINSGSFLQSFALKTILEREGHEVYFLKHGVKKPNWLMLGSIIKSILKLNFSKANFSIKKWIGFSKEQQVFNELSLKDYNVGEELYIFGSDEIWNLARESFIRYPILWGEGINSTNRIAYAPSVNKATFEQVSSKEFVLTNLNKFKKLMVRDNHTKNIISGLVDKDVHVVLDPTMLLEPGEFEVKQNKIQGDYILIYSYGRDKDSEQISNIKKFAKNKGLKIISGFSHLDWVDKNMGCSPSEFVTLIKNANYVITDTFHGTVFSILFSKQFVSYAKDNTKVIEILNAFDLNSRITNSTSKLDEIMDLQIDYDKIKKTINELRKFSLEQLKNSIH